MIKETLFSPQSSENIEQFSAENHTELLTIVFTDIVGSTRMKQELGDVQGARIIQAYRDLTRSLLARFPQGREIETAGDSFLLVFIRPSDAVKFSLLLHHDLPRLNRELHFRLENRIGIHLGEVVVGQSEENSGRRNLFGIQLDTCARIMSLAQGNQILTSRWIFDNARQVLRGQTLASLNKISWLSHGFYELKGCEEPVEICEVGEEGIAPFAVPPNTEKAVRSVTVNEDRIPGWRPAVDLKVPNTEWVLQEKIGAGIVGEVWKATHSVLGDTRAFKFCFSEEGLRTLKREVTLLRVLRNQLGDHPHIVRLYEVYLDSPPYYLLMDYIHGKDLKGWFTAQNETEQIPISIRLEIVAQVAETLQAAHDTGVIHRDIKPSNILVERSTSTNEISVKVADFGIGQLVSADREHANPALGFSVTIFAHTPASIAGTQLYMPPEVLSGQPASIRSDLYSLGVVFYQLLISDFTRPVTSEWKNNIKDPLLREDLALCLAENPQERFSGGAELARRLRSLPKRRKHRRRKLAVLSGIAGFSFLTILLLAGILFLKVALQREQQLRIAAENSYQYALHEQYFADIVIAENSLQNHRYDRARFYLSQAPKPYLGWEWGRLLYLSSLEWSPVHREMFRISEESVQKDALSIATSLLSAGQTQLEIDSPGLSVLALSPDRKSLVAANHSSNTLHCWDLEKWTSHNLVLNSSSPVQSLDFHPTKKSILITLDDGTLYSWLLTTVNPIQLNSTLSSPVMVTYNSDGKLIYGLNRNSVTTWSGESETETGSIALSPPIPEAELDVCAAFAPDGSWVVMAWSGIFQIWDCATGEILTRISRTVEHLISALAVSPDGNLICTGYDEGTLILWNRNTGGKLRSLTGHQSKINAIIFTRDGTRIITASQDKTIRIWETRTAREILTFEFDAPIVAHQLSPDGTLLTAGEEQGSIHLLPALPLEPFSDPLANQEDFTEKVKTVKQTFWKSPVQEHEWIDE